LRNEATQREQGKTGVAEEQHHCDRDNGRRVGDEKRDEHEEELICWMSLVGARHELAGLRLSWKAK